MHSLVHVKPFNWTFVFVLPYMHGSVINSPLKSCLLRSDRWGFAFSRPFRADPRPQKPQPSRVDKSERHMAILSAVQVWFVLMLFTVFTVRAPERAHLAALA